MAQRAPQPFPAQECEIRSATSSFPGFVIAFALIVSVSGCAREPQAHFSFGQKFRLVSVAATRKSCARVSPLAVKSASCEHKSDLVEDETISLCLFPDSTEIRAAITNNSTGPLRIDLEKSRYVDERGVRHPLVVENQTMIAPAQRRVFAFAPKEKRYYVRSAVLEEVEYAEPLIPFDMDELSATQVESMLDSMEAAGRVVKLELAIGGTPCDSLRYEIQFRLAPLYSEAQWSEVQQTTDLDSIP